MQNYCGSEYLLVLTVLSLYKNIKVEWSENCPQNIHINLQNSDGNTYEYI